VTTITDTGDSQAENSHGFSRFPEEHLYQGATPSLTRRPNRLHKISVEVGVLSSEVWFGVWEYFALLSFCSRHWP
jgi:hypothetical protein